MCYVSQSKGGARAHFRHVSSSCKRALNDAPDGIACDCSDAHVLAQSLIKEHINRIQFKAWRECKKCQCTAFGPANKATAKLEVSMQSNTGAIRADVAVYVGSRLMLTVEVKHTHATDAASRDGVKFVEVDAKHAIDAIQSAKADDRVITLICSATNAKPCEAFCEGYEDLFRNYCEELYESCSWNEKRNHQPRSPIPFQGKMLCGICHYDYVLSSYSTCYPCSMALKDERNNTNKALPLLEKRWRKLRQSGLVYVGDQDDEWWVKGRDGATVSAIC
jgi:hypothetical protein